MANIMVVSGYVKSVKNGQGFMNIQVSVPDGKDQQGQMRYVPVTVHVSLSQNEQVYLSVSEGMQIMAQGRYSKYKSQDGVWFDQLRCFQSDVYVSQKPVQNQPAPQQGYYQQPSQQGYQQAPYGAQSVAAYQAPQGGVPYDSIPF